MNTDNIQMSIYWPSLKSFHYCREFEDSILPEEYVAQLYNRIKQYPLLNTQTIPSQQQQQQEANNNNGAPTNRIAEKIRSFFNK